VRFDESYARAAARWPAGTAELRVPTSWGETSLLTAGPAGAPAVLLLHGGGATATAWADLAGRLAGRFRLLAPDQPGDPGRSTSTRPFRSTADLVSWLAELQQVTGARHLVGHSAGAHLALSSALADGDRWATLSLLDPTACFAGFGPRYLLHALPTLVRPTDRRVRRFLAWETRGRALPPAWLDAYARGATDVRGAPIVRTRRPGRQQLAALQVPTLVVVAGGSRVHDAARVAASAARLPAITVVEVPGATHHTMPLLDVAVVATAVAAHLDADG
jgi:pimeloyl-ACP methyl ester carboxylesterase